MLKMRKLAFATMTAFLSTGLLLGCAAEDEENPEEPATEEPTEQEDPATEEDSGTEEEGQE